MKNENQIFGSLHLWECLTSEFLEETAKKYHYGKREYDALKKTASDIKICIKDQENFCLTFSSYAAEGEETHGLKPGGILMEPEVLVAMSLGSNLDLLQERYHRQERLMESYMLENISSELLRFGYEKVHRLIVEKTGMYVGKVRFYGEEEPYSFVQMAKRLQECGIRNVSCTKDYCLRPTKSVVYSVRLAYEETVSRSICSDCKNRRKCHPCVVDF